MQTSAERTPSYIPVEGKNRFFNGKFFNEVSEGAQKKVVNADFEKHVIPKFSVRSEKILSAKRNPFLGDSKRSTLVKTFRFRDERKYHKRPKG